MATVGQQLLQPETGWRRYDDTDKRFNYTGNFQVQTNAGAAWYNGTTHYGAQGIFGQQVSFTFYGSKLRIIGNLDISTNRSNNIQIIIDNITYTYSEVFSSNLPLAITFEKLDLSRGYHTVTIKAGTGISTTYPITFDAIDIDDTGDLLGTGIQLTTPETGWRRYDDTDSRIKYTGNFIVSTSSGFYSGSLKTSNIINDKIVFKFYGTKLRLLTYMNAGWSDSIQIKIDSLPTDNFSMLGTGASTIDLCYEKLGLTLGIHTVEISTMKAAYFGLDAIDIDATGYLVHPTLNEVHSLNDVKSIGDCIPCRYTALTSGQVGIFSELGTCMADPIPTTSSTTPDGSFYWLYVGKDYLGRKKFIADRNIQNSLSWDILNSAGICSEVTIFNRANPIMSSNTTKGLAKAGSIYNSTYDAYKAFNGIEKQTSDCWGTAYNIDSSSAWLSYSFENSIMIDSYYMSMPTRTDSAAAAKPTSWKLEATNDNNTWVTLDTRDSIVWNNTGNRIYFKFNNSQTYKTYRITITRVQSGLPPFTYGAIIGELIFIEKTNNNLSMRLLTGGISVNDIDNEWDKIIAGSTLGGKITAGDNNVWAWKSGVDMWTLTSTRGTTNTTVVKRGNGLNSLVNSYSAYTSSDTTYSAFRPVLLVETLKIDKYLLKKDLKYYSIKPEYYDEIAHTFIPLTLAGGSDPSAIDIETFGFDDLKSLIIPITKGSDTFKPIDKLNNCQIKYYIKN